MSHGLPVGGYDRSHTRLSPAIVEVEHLEWIERQDKTHTASLLAALTAFFTQPF